MREALLLVVLTLGLVSSGCLGSAVEPAAVATEPAAARAATHVLDGAAEPDALEAPTFRLLGALASGGPVYGAGEPSAWAALDGTLYVAFPGCDHGAGLAMFVLDVGCAHGLVYRSGDEGASWERLNDEESGRLDEESPAANGDADVTVDSAGNVFASNLGGGGIRVHRLMAGAEAWEDAGNVVPEDAWADRQWMAAAGPGHVIVAWMGGAKSADRQVAITTTRDAGDSWSNVTYLGEDIGWLGSVQFAPDGLHAYVPYTQPVEALSPPLFLYQAQRFHLFVARTADGGATWESVDTGIAVETSVTGGHWSGVLMAPTLDVTGDGTLVYAWTEEVLDPTGATATGSVLKASASADGGGSWTQPLALSSRAQAILPWATGGAGDRVAITYMASDVPGDSDYVGAWDVVAVVVDGLASSSPRVVETVVDTLTHEGGACTRGGLCLLTGSDRALLDFFEADLLPDGRLFLTYPADPLAGGKRIEIRTAIQDGGTPLLTRAQ